jgi:hypothetical protein
VKILVPRILIAAAPAAAKRLQGILAAYPMAVVQTVREAQDALAAERFTLAILGVYFDESRMFEVMSYARVGALNRDLPIVCVRGIPGNMSPTTLCMLQQTINALSGCEFLDLIAIADDDAGNALVLRRLTRHLGSALLQASPPDVPAVRPTP